MSYKIIYATGGRTTIDVAAGEQIAVKAKGVGAVQIERSQSPFSKKLDLEWEQGNLNGGRADGVTFTASTWYRHFVLSTFFASQDQPGDAGYSSATDDSGA